MADLEPVAEDWTRALAVVAHPDDLEYGAASAIARWTDQGKEIAYCLVMAGEAGIDGLAPDECARVRTEEERRSAAVVGVDTVEFLGHADGLVEAGPALRRDLAGAIRRHRPEVLISLNFRDSWGGPSWNHVDHRATGIALLDAARDAGNRWIFPGVGGEPWAGVRFAIFSGSPAATHAVDVGQTLERGRASLREHRAYLDGLGAPGDTAGGDRDPTEFLVANAAQAGARFGVVHAVPFELIAL